MALSKTLLACSYVCLRFISLSRTKNRNSALFLSNEQKQKYPTDPGCLGSLRTSEMEAAWDPVYKGKNLPHTLFIALAVQPNFQQWSSSHCTITQKCMEVPASLCICKTTAKNVLAFPKPITTLLAWVPSCSCNTRINNSTTAALRRGFPSSLSTSRASSDLKVHL